MKKIAFVASLCGALALFGENLLRNGNAALELQDWPENGMQLSAEKPHSFRNLPAELNQ